MRSRPTTRRRALIAGAAGSLAAASGCIGELRNLAGRERTRQLSLSVATLPANHDASALRIANHLREHLQRAGIDASVSAMAPDALLRDVLVNHQFDLYVGRYPSEGRPDELRTLLHSTYGEEAGWQNPFGFSSVGLDDRLDAQRDRTGDARVETVRSIQDRIVEHQPFTVVAIDDRISAANTARFHGWPAAGPGSVPEYLAVERTGEATTLRPTLTDVRPTRNLNPIAVEHRDHNPVTPLLYEPLVRRVDGDPTPWLARSVTWREDPASATVTLRDAEWHDGTPVRPSDVRFTYEFLQDTSLGELDTPVPTSWRRGAASLVDSVSVVDDDARVEFTAEAIDVARRALELPVLPEHVWSEYTGAADLGGIDIVGGTTEALVRNNEQPVGSGPLRVTGIDAEQSVSLEAFDGHFLARGDTAGIPDRVADGPAFDRATFEVAPSEDAAAEVLASGDADVVADELHADTVPAINRDGSASLLVARTEPFYLVGYNCRRRPLSNQRFRRVLARLIDREHLVTAAFRDYAAAAEAPLRGRWAPPALEWDGTARLSFFGSDGELDVAAARSAFREAGYQYDDDQLVVRGSR